MVLYGVAEFRNSENRKSKNGNEYKILKFEDENGNNLGFYWDGKLDSVISAMDLQKGKSYELEFNYRYDNFNHSYRLDLISINGEVNGK